MESNELKSEYEFYKAQYEALKQKEDNKIISQMWVKADTKPEHNVGVLVFIPGEDNHITSGMWDISNKWVLLDEYRTPEEEVTHWMPLPAFPEGYKHDVISDEWVSTLKAIAKEELAKKKESAAGNNPEPKWVKGALQWAKETIDFAWDYVKVPESLTETWGNMYMNTMHAIQQAQQEDESAAGREDAVEFAEWIRDNTVPDGAPKLFYKPDISRYSIQQLYTIFKQQKENNG